MPKGAKKRAKLKKQQQQGHPDDGGNSAHNANGNGNGSDNNITNRRDADHHHLRIPSNASHVDASEDSMESSEEMVTPRAAGSEVDEERKPATEVHVEHAAEVVEEDGPGPGEEVMVDALPPEAGGHELEGKVDSKAEVHAVVQEPEVKDVVVAEAPAVQELEVAEVPAVQEPEVAEAPTVEVPEVTEAPTVEVPEVKREVAKVHPVQELERKVDDVVMVGETPVADEPEVKGGVVTVVETVSAPRVQEPETKREDAVFKDSAEVSRSREAVDVHTTEVARGPAVAVAASGQRATWWNCCGIFDAFAGSER